MLEQQETGYGGHRVANRDRQGDAGESKRTHQEQCGTDVDDVLAEVEPEGGLGPVHGLKGPDHILEHREAHEA